MSHGVWRLVLLCSLAGSGLAQTIFSDFGPNHSFATGPLCISGATTPNCGNATQRRIAAPFKPAATFTLTSIDLALSNYSGTNGATVTLNNDSAGTPGTLLATWNLANLPTNYPSTATVTVTATSAVT